MNKRAVIFHGTGGTPDVCWYKWLGNNLTQRGFDVEIPYFPTINIEPISTFLPKVFASQVFDENTILIGHSAGATLLLSILEKSTNVIPQAFFVAGYATKPNESEEPFLQSDYDWDKIKSHVKDAYFINSINDPYGCDDKQGRRMFEKIGGTQIVLNEGHFGSENQDYPTFEILNRLIR
jgi:predicted alpha/beta hydrolase family esterase